MHRLEIIYKKSKRTFKASKNVWWWFLILEFRYKLTLSLSMKLEGLMSTDFDRFSRFCGVLKMLKWWKLWELRTEKEAGLQVSF